ncbi:MAG: sensor signal transduction histidine kinase, partial [Ilumatobacteraceae bacterium]|nr:sensor signal transduction histidine kinase [Ilumatobacteraceae bacterium]
MTTGSTPLLDGHPRPATGEAFGSSLEMLCTVRFDGCITAANASLLAGLGGDEADLLGTSSFDHVHPDDLDATLERADELLAGHDVPAFENRYRRQDGSYRWLAWSARSDPANAQVHCAARDVTEDRRHRDLVDKLLAELERSNTDLAQFAYVASHDLSEPLRMVSSYVGLLAARYEGQLDADADEFIGYAVDGANRMKALIDDLLAYSRSGFDVAVRRPVDCDGLVRSAVADLEQAIGEAAATVEVGELPVVQGDPGQLSQVFQNLLSNALKFVAPDVPAHVRVTATRTTGAWRFSVADNGIGIAPEHRKRVFLMFKRLHGRAQYPGTGIGLALCHKIVTRFGGQIWLAEDTEQG